MSPVPVRRELQSDVILKAGKDIEAMIDRLA